jgi:uncharacterized cupredoxin-like copper-binding protein
LLIFKATFAKILKIRTVKEDVMKKIILFFVLVLVAVALVACGGGPSNTINVAFTDFHFTPEAFVIPAGQEITITAVNNGTVEHEFVIMKYGTTVGDDFGPEDAGNIYWQIQAQAGETAQKIFTAPTDPGDYQVVCGTPGHFMAGMVGKLTVVVR